MSGFADEVVASFYEEGVVVGEVRNAGLGNMDMWLRRRWSRGERGFG